MASLPPNVEKDTVAVQGLGWANERLSGKTAKPPSLALALPIDTVGSGSSSTIVPERGASRYPAAVRRSNESERLVAFVSVIPDHGDADRRAVTPAANGRSVPVVLV